MKMSDLLKDYLSHNKAFFEHLKNKKAINIRNDVDFIALSGKVHQEFAPVFVLSTGRNGTLLLTNLLSKSKNAVVLHEPEPELSMASKLAYENYQSNPEFVKGMFEGARYEYLRTAFLLNKSYIETNNRITFFANEIAELYPNSMFIHLVRHPSSFIKSGIGRKWYTGQTLYDEARIVASDEKFWSHLNQYDKIAWLWNETNLFIENFKNKTEKKRVLTVKAEDLFTKSEITSQIMNFCGISDVSLSTIKKMISVKVNAGAKTNIDSSSLENAIKNHSPLLKNYY